MCSTFPLPASNTARPTVCSAPGGSPSRAAHSTEPKSVASACAPRARRTWRSIGGAPRGSCGRWLAAQHPAGARIGLASALGRHLPVYHDVLDAAGILARLGIGGDVLDRRRVEDDHVRVPAGAQHAAAPEPVLRGG